jgi:hypothetical protein
MAATIPSIEPRSARAGDTWAWTRDLPDYPAGSWTLTYLLYSAAGVWPITATADGDTHAVAATQGETSQIPAGRFDWTASVSDGTDRYQVGSGAIQVLPDLSSAASYDGRSHARRMLDAINAIMEGRAGEGDIDLVRTSFGDRAAEFDLERLMRMRQQYAWACQAEDNAERLARGDQSGRYIATRFVG